MVIARLPVLRWHRAAREHQAPRRRRRRGRRPEGGLLDVVIAVELRRRGDPQARLLKRAARPFRAQRVGSVDVALDGQAGGAVEQLAPEVGVGLVERPGLPAVDQAVGRTGPGVRPLVDDDVVDAESGAEGGDASARCSA